ncbi:hypothetical protein D3C72_1638700 [compost metagenome]
MPVIRPEAMKAGIKGIKTSASFFSAPLIGAAYFCLACALLRAMLSPAAATATAGAPVSNERIASTTLAAAPGPTMN